MNLLTIWFLLWFLW